MMKYKVVESTKIEVVVEVTEKYIGEMISLCGVKYVIKSINNRANKYKVIAYNKNGTDNKLTEASVVEALNKNVNNRRIEE